MATALFVFQPWFTTTAEQINLSQDAIVSQSSNFGGSAYPASNAIDNDPNTFTHTDDIANSYWMATFLQPTPVDRIELVNRNSCCDNRMNGLVLRFLDENNQTIEVTNISNPGLGGTWSYEPLNTVTAKYVRVGLENNNKNGGNNYYVTLAEVRMYADNYTPPAFPTNNLALNKDSYMLRLNDSLPPAANGNDGNLNSETTTLDNTVGGFWEVDLGTEYAITNVMIVPANNSASGIYGTTLTLFDTNHDAVYSQHLSGSVPPFCTIKLPSTHIARYAKVGIENKARYSFGIKEMFVYGRPASEVGIHSFTTSVHNISAGGSATLSWQSEEVLEISIYPHIGSVIAQTDPSGHGSINVSPLVSTTYTLIATNATTIYTRYVAVKVDGQPLLPRISEFMADNRLTIKDGKSNASDWIEIFNPDDQPRTMTGYALSDSPGKPQKWSFPPAIIPPFGYLLVFASGESESHDADGNLHANWRLSAAGESVVLTAPDGVTTVDSIINFPAQCEDLAYGRNLHGELMFLEPTPEAPNRAMSYAGWLTPPEFSHIRGFHTNAFSLSINNSNTGATLLYSLDGTEPSTPYTGALAITGTTTVRARVIQPEFKSPRTQTASYIFIADTLASSVMNQNIVNDSRYAERLKSGMTELPTLSIAIPQLPDDYIKREASVELFLPGSPEPIQANCEMVRYGGAYTTFTKKNYRLKFHSRYGTPKLIAPLFKGMDRGFPVSDKFDELELGGGSHDMQDRGFYMSARFVEDSMLEMGSLNPHGCFAHLFINGVYWGQFHLRERLVAHFMADYLGGATEAYYNIRGNDNYGDNFVLGAPEPLHRSSWDRIRNLQNSYQSVKPYLDVPHLIDFCLLWSYGNCESEYRATGPIDAGSGVKFWMADADGFLRTTGDRTATTGPSNLFGTLKQEGDPDFKTLVADRIYKHHFNDGALTPAKCSQRLASRMAEIQNSLIAECARWGFRSPDNWLSAAQNIQNNMFPVRTAQQITNLKNRGLYPSFDPPAFDQRGGLVPPGHQPIISTPVGTIYYTLDNSDPRLPGGGVSSSALIYNSGSSASIETLIPTGAAWKYLDNGSDQGTAWKELSFNDSTWAAGYAKFGYGPEEHTTTISYGPNASQRYITSYFRAEFTVNASADIFSLTLRLLRDDGAIVYLNGTEIVRDNMPASGVNYRTFASLAVGGTAETTYYPFTLPAHLLVDGSNLLAVEIHQINLTSSDHGFDLELTANRRLHSDPEASITLSNDTVITTRVLNNGAWSALDSATFLMMNRAPASAENLVITEINYDPAGSDDYEFIELYNCGTNIADLSGVTLSTAVTFTFPAGSGLEPGAFLLVVEDNIAFEERYCNPASTWYYPGIAVAGKWSGALNNAGETIDLIASNNTVIASVSYQPGNGWPERANNRGSSLELRSVASLPSTQPARDSFLADPANWQGSALYHGSPGRFDSGGPPLVINEVLSHTDLEVDWIELHNSSASAITLAGFYLSDTSNNLLRYQIPESAVIPPHGFISFGAAELGFGFSELGSEALLIQGVGTDVIRFIDSVDFPAAAREEPFGRYRKSDNTVDFTELITVSRDATNALARVGPVIVSEIMYRPLPDKAEYIEIVNTSDAAVLLYDINRPANTWELSEAVTFAFPSGLELPPATPLIICATNPAIFRTQYAVPPSITVLGPWKGALNNAGETLLLRSPGDPEPDGFVPYYRADHISYLPQAPWPAAANNSDISLIRRSSTAYGNDPGSWSASQPGGTPGVLDYNWPPVWQAIPQQFNPAGLYFALNCAAYASDPNLPLQSLSYAQSGLPQGITLNSASGLISGICSNQGSYAVTLVVTDNHPLPAAATNNLVLTITEPFVMQINAAGPEGFMLSIPTIAGESYEVQVSDSLTPVDWKLLQSRHNLGTNLWQLIDPDANSHTQRFYRVLWLEY
ncbi:MAG: lamin tail domain-containing protein [Kiritimatiellae bacterium]|nr:lamin tail domain-containing protein [Kiritimatiellia bacterium]